MYIMCTVDFQVLENINIFFWFITTVVANEGLEAN